MKYTLLFFILILVSFSMNGQQLNLPINSDFQTRYNQQLYDTSNNFHTSFQPYIESFVNLKKKSTPTFKTRFHKIEKIILHESLIKIGNDSLNITIDPLFYIEQAKDNNTKTTYIRNTRGFWIRGNVGNNVSFETSFLENQITTPTYLNDFVTQYKVYPGMGRTKAFKKTGYDYAMASGYVSYMPIKYLNLQFGHGKLFVGNGYRSLLLSDNAFNYPHFKTIYQYKKLQYTWVIASLMNIQNPILIPFSEPLFRKKQTSFHTLSFKPNKRFEIALIQGVTYNIDAVKFNWNSLNPIIYTQALSYGLGTKNNVVLGLNANAKITKDVLTYGQLMCDDFNKNKLAISNKTGYQVGVYYKNVLGIKQLNTRIEYNVIRPFAYQQGSEAQAYTHYNQSLAHPLNANFKEAVFIADYNIKNFLFKVKIISANVGVDSTNFNAGTVLINSTNKNIGNANFSDVKILQGNVKNLLVQDFSVGYLINPTYNFCVRAGYFKRNFTGNDVSYFYLNVSAFILNQYLDF